MEALGVNLRRPTTSLENLVQIISGHECYQDTFIYCSDGPPLIIPKLLVGVMFPVLRNCEYFNLMSENCVHLPDYSFIQVKQMFKGETAQDPLSLDTEVGGALEVDECVVEEVVPEFFESYLAEDTVQYAVQVHHPQNIGKPGYVNASSCIIEEEDRTKRKSYKGEIFPGEYPYKCSFCDKRFKQVGHVNHHERKHTGTKKYNCEVCGKRFNQRSHLLDHTRIHTGEKPFKCTQCGKAYAFSSSLKSHFATHTGERLYKCTFCEKTFKHRANLKTHERLHTGNLKFMCSECGKCFNTKSNMLRHLCRPAVDPEVPLAASYVTMWDSADINIINKFVDTRTQDQQVQQQQEQHPQEQQQQHHHQQQQQLM